MTEVPWDVYVQFGLGLAFFLISFGRSVKQIALMEIERDLKAGRPTPGHQAWLRRNLPAFYRVLGAGLIALAAVQYTIAAEVISK